MIKAKAEFAAEEKRLASSKEDKKKVDGQRMAKLIELEKLDTQMQAELTANEMLRA